MNSKRSTSEASMTSKALWKERTLCTMYADMCLFTPWISIIGDAPNYRIPERMQIGTSFFPFSAPLYLPPLSFLSGILSFSQAWAISLATKRICAWRIKKEDRTRASGREKQRGRELEMCWDGWEERWEAKVDSGKIGKRGLKGLLRDGNTSVETTRFKDQNEDGVHFGNVPNGRKTIEMVDARSPSKTP